MGDFPRKADGRRIFTAEFKRGVVQQILKGEKTLAEVSRELDIQPTVIRQWKRRVEAGVATAVAADEDVVPASLLRAAQARIKELERSLVTGIVAMGVDDSHYRERLADVVRLLY
jgi:transposase